MGGIIYILNIIKILDFLNDDEKPEILLFYRPDLKKYADEAKYPYLKVVEWKYPTVYKGYLKSWFLHKNIFVDKILRQYDLDVLYPLHDYPIKTKTKTKLICWYADLQHEHYPEFFTRRKIIERTARIRFMLRNTDFLVVSSQDVANDFSKFFTLRQNMKVHIFHFASVIDYIEDVNHDNLRAKYKLPKKYFIVSNQFYQHKNHKILLEALVKLKGMGSSVHLVITGRFPDKSHSPYLHELHEIIKRNDLHNQISFLGIISRKDQLVLMKHSQALIQPSLFEGWSTVIEDAKSLQVPVVASNIPVNIEQLGKDGLYFEPHNPEELASILSVYPERNISDVFYDDYSRRIKSSARVLMKIFL